MLKSEINNNVETYRFQAGRSVVTVQAETAREAEIMAAAKLTDRAAKFFVQPPANGWDLQRLRSAEA